MKEQSAVDGFGRSYRSLCLALMTSLYMLNLTDRGLIVLSLEAIKSDLSLSDTQLGFLNGIAFAFFYAVAGIPIARAADRGNRVGIASFAIGLWGATVMLCVLVSSYSQLILARVLASIGEAGCKPPTYSLLGDYFPGSVARMRALSIYWLGSPLSAIVSFVAGGWLLEHYGWRMTFLVMGFPGIILAIFFWLIVREPRSAGDRAKLKASQGSATDVFMMLWRDKPCRHLSVAIILFFTVGSGLYSWFGAFLIRVHGMGNIEVGSALGIIFGAGGIVGILSGGFAISRWFPDDPCGQLRASSMIAASIVPCLVIFLIAENILVSLTALFFALIVLNLVFAPSFALMQGWLPEGMRATSMSVVMLFANLIGMGFGSQIVGMLSDLLAPDFGNNSLRIAMLIVSFSGLWAALHFRISAREYDVAQPSRS